MNIHSKTIFIQQRVKCILVKNKIVCGKEKIPSCFPCTENILSIMDFNYLTVFKDPLIFFLTLF